MDQATERKEYGELLAAGMITDQEHAKLCARFPTPEPDKTNVVGLNKFGDLTVGPEVVLALDLPNPMTLPERRDRK